MPTALAAEEESGSASSAYSSGRRHCSKCGTAWIIEFLASARAGTISETMSSSSVSEASMSVRPSGVTTCEPPVHGQRRPLLLGLPTVLAETCHTPFSTARHGMCMRFSSGPRELSELTSTWAPRSVRQRAVSGRMPSAQTSSPSRPMSVLYTLYGWVDATKRVYS